MIDLSLVAAPSVIETLSFDDILAAMLADLESRDPVVFAGIRNRPADPAHKILEVAAYREMLIRARINDAAKSVMLAYATGTDLDHLALLFGIERNPIVTANPNAIPPVQAVWETDSDFRARILLELDSKTTAGSANSYIAHAREVDFVDDAGVDSPSPGVVRVTILRSPSSAATDAEVVDAVKAVLTHEDVRPLTDTVEVFAATPVNFSVVASIRPLPGPDAAQLVERARLAAEAYVKSNFKVGRAITLSGLYAALHQPGVARVDLASPTSNLVATATQVLRCTGITVTNGGVL